VSSKGLAFALLLLIASCSKRHFVVFLSPTHHAEGLVTPRVRAQNKVTDIANRVDKLGTRHVESENIKFKMLADLLCRFQLTTFSKKKSNFFFKKIFSKKYFQIFFFEFFLKINQKIFGEIFFFKFFWYQRSAANLGHASEFFWGLGPLV
jgi:hypothetical protein